VSNFAFTQNASERRPTYKDVLTNTSSGGRSGKENPSIDYDHVLKQTSGTKLKGTWILLDNQSTVDVIQNARLLTNIREVATSMHIHCNAGVATTNWMGDLAGYGPVWYHKDGITNILLLARVKEKYRVTYDSTDGNEFRVHRNDGTHRVFRESANGLYYMDVSDPLVSTVLVNTIAENKAKYTQCNYSQAVLACKPQKIIGRPSLRDYVHMVKNRLIPNCPITVQDIMAAEHIFGPDVGCLKGKRTRTNADPVRVQLTGVLVSIME
jgi:hypothetical protein